MAEAKWDTTGLQKLLGRLQELENRVVEWGFFPESKYGPENDNLPVAEVAKRNNDGEGHIPPRPFFSTHAERLKVPGEPMNVKMIFNLKSTVTDAFLYTTKYRTANLKRLGKVLQEGLQEEILDWSFPENAKSTEKNKGFNDPLIHTGRMYDSVKVKIKTRSSEEDA